MVELLNVDVSTKWLVHMIHGHLSHLKQPGSASGGVGKMDGMSSDRSDLQLRSPRTGGWGSACCILLECRTEVWSSVNQLRRGGLDGWCETMTGGVRQ